MCICHLPCRHLKNNLSTEQVSPYCCCSISCSGQGEVKGSRNGGFPGPQASGRLRAHYHCVVCSVTIARKTDMVSHLKRHANKGETEATYSGGSDVLREDHGNRTADEQAEQSEPQQSGVCFVRPQLRQVTCARS